MLSSRSLASSSGSVDPDSVSTVEEKGKSLIEFISQVRTTGLPFAAPKSALRTVEAALVRDVLQMLQGYPNSSFLWDESALQFYLKKGIYVSHLSQASFSRLVHRFVYAATSLRRVEGFVNKVAQASCNSEPLSLQAPPTLQAFAHAVSLRLEHLRRAAREKELKAVGGGPGTIVTLLSVSASLSWVCTGAEFLEQVVNEAVPLESIMHEDVLTPAELGSHIFSYLYDKLTEFCLVQDGEEEPYRTLLLLFIGSLRPLTECLDIWLHEGILSDPFGELFFHANRSVEIEDATFWQHGFHLRSLKPISTLLTSANGRFSEETPSTDSVESLAGATSTKNGKGRQKTGNVQKSAGDGMDSPSADMCIFEDKIVCPSFLRCIAKAILSTGKSLQLLQHVCRNSVSDIDANDPNNTLAHSSVMPPVFLGTRNLSDIEFRHKTFGFDSLTTSTILVKNSSFEPLKNGEGQDPGEHNVHQALPKSLYEELCQSLERLLGQNLTSSSIDNGQDEICQMMRPRVSLCSNGPQEGENQESSHESLVWNSEESKQKYLQRVQKAPEANGNLQREALKDSFNQGSWLPLKSPESSEELSTHLLHKCGTGSAGWSGHHLKVNGLGASYENHKETFATVFQKELKALSPAGTERYKLGDRTWEICLNLSRSCTLPALDDTALREAIFTESDSVSSAGQLVDLPLPDSGEVCGTSLRREREVDGFETDNRMLQSAYSSELRGTDYGNGPGCGNLLAWHVKQDLKSMEHLFPYPTALPFFKEGLPISELLPSQRHQRVAPLILYWLQKAEFKATPLPSILVEECLITFILKQVEAVGKRVLDRLMGEWRLMEELTVLRAIYLIGSGDLLQQFCSVLFGKLDRGEPWDDFYELNTMLQESVRSSADGMLLPVLDSLVITVQSRSSLAAEHGPGPVPLHFPGRGLTFGIDTLDSLSFSYKVAWPLELIIDNIAIKKYNQVMTFLLKIKRAKFALDKACRWMWKNGGGDATNLKQQLLLQQKLMHFVNTLHQYVMDRVLYSTWVELCEGMVSAGSLDEVIAVHDAYLVSIQRQCLVAPDKLWALIASRVRTILGLALDFYSIQRTLRGGGAAPAIKARSQLEIDRIGRQFDECIVFLLRVLSFKLNVGHFPHLGELVTRINYNYYYMSKSGHLLTPLPEISSGRGGRMGAYNQ